MASQTLSRAFGGFLGLSTKSTRPITGAKLADDGSEKPTTAMKPRAGKKLEGSSMVLALDLDGLDFCETLTYEWRPRSM
jgi:hypothetical protein